MVRSMTGYGRGEAALHGRSIVVEVRAVNNRYLDCAIKMPRAYIFAEDAMKTRVQAATSRGKVDVFVTLESTGADAVTVKVNHPVAAGYITALKELKETYQLLGMADLPMVARFPDVFQVEKAPENIEEAAGDICAVLDLALADFTGMREREGERLRADILARADAIEALVAKVEEQSPRTVAEYRTRLENRMREVLQNQQIEESRILTEAAIFADKVAVDEETVRLRSHVAQLRTMLESDEPMGRKMDFLIQEVNRESNTIGSKCSDVAIAKVVVDLKAEVEKMREQVQNVE